MSEQLLTLLTGVLSKNACISTEPEVLAMYLQGTEGLENFQEKKRNIFALIKVSKQTDVKAVLTLANELSANSELRFTLYPVSTGKNWGYGTSQPAEIGEHIILLDLSLLNNISYFDEELGLVTLEPGVTQQQLSNFLIENDYPYMVPVTGAGPDCSILANALERGYGITPYTDHFSAVNSIQGYWADGSCFQSAVNTLDQSTEQVVDKTYKWGLGPYLDGLFTQSSFGVVTQMTIRLAKIKPAFTSFFIQLADDELMEQAIPLIRKTLQDYEGIVGSINLMDQRRVLSMFAKNPNGNEQHKVMSDSDVKQLAKQQQTPSWTIVGSIYGSKSVVKAVKTEINNLFKQIPCKRIYSTSPVLVVVNKFINALPKWLVKRVAILTMIAQQMDSFDKGKAIMLGRPNKVALKLAYWRNPESEQLDPEELSPSNDNCGLLWYAPLITMKASIMRDYVNFIRTTCPKYNIEPFITFTNLKHDCVDSTIPIVFDLTNPKAVEDAHNCLKELVTEGLKKGFVPYRLNIDQQQWLLDKEQPFWQTVNKLKQVLDPNAVLSLGRYNPK
ncbi:FAD-binding protein [Litorilituus sediminis]|uniref:FAD-binding oxidoreductase n=1 Tax=Litorilituus sediminis TaxID=718192 RepID=A0A4P6P4N9_9GAMM|nr:FAD-binding protein [Litorilituus sediminis]QBG36636.1 FAD-binding oxidoreductase [Litorilituus sediminis]